MNSMQNMAIPSLSYDPATEREMYPGTMDSMAAATRPAPSSCNRNTTWTSVGHLHPTVSAAGPDSHLEPMCIQCVQCVHTHTTPTCAKIQFLTTSINTSGTSTTYICSTHIYYSSTLHLSNMHHHMNSRQ